MTSATEEQKRLSLDEISVLRELAKWRRRSDVGADFDFFSPAYRFNGGRTIMWLTPGSQATCMKVGVTPNYTGVQAVWHKVASVAQAIDLLVALGYLPARFSTAYRAGWDAYNEASEIGEAARPYTEMMPAWGPTW